MKATGLTQDQARAIYQRLQPMVGFLLKLQERMEQRGFERDDKFFRLAKRAYDATHELFLEAHHLSSSGVGRK